MRSVDEAQRQPDEPLHMARAVAELRSCVRELEDAMRAEAIDPLALLGVWCRVLQSSIGVRTTFAAGSRFIHRPSCVNSCVKSSVKGQIDANNLMRRLRKGSAVVGEMTKVGG